MPLQQLQFDFAPRQKVTVSEALRTLAKYRIFTPNIDDETLLNFVHEGSIEGRKIGGRWFLYVDSFESWVKSLDEPMMMAA